MLEPKNLRRNEIVGNILRLKLISGFIVITVDEDGESYVVSGITTNMWYLRDDDIRHVAVLVIPFGEIRSASKLFALSTT